MLGALDTQTCHCAHKNMHLDMQIWLVDFLADCAHLSFIVHASTAQVHNYILPYIRAYMHTYMHTYPHA